MNNTIFYATSPRITAPPQRITDSRLRITALSSQRITSLTSRITDFGSGHPVPRITTLPAIAGVSPLTAIRARARVYGD